MFVQELALIKINKERTGMAAFKNVCYLEVTAVCFTYYEWEADNSI